MQTINIALLKHIMFDSRLEYSPRIGDRGIIYRKVPKQLVLFQKVEKDEINQISALTSNRHHSHPYIAFNSKQIFAGFDLVNFNI